MKTFNGFGLRITTPDHWEDITDEEGDIPFLTLARETGDGALQFAAGLHNDERVISPQTLSEAIEAFGKSFKCGAHQDVVTEAEPLLLAAATLLNQTMRMWHISDGRHSALVLYTCQGDSLDAGEVQECEMIVRNIRFVV